MPNRKIKWLNNSFGILSEFHRSLLLWQNYNGKRWKTPKRIKESTVTASHFIYMYSVFFNSVWIFQTSRNLEFRSQKQPARSIFFNLKWKRIEKIAFVQPHHPHLEWKSKSLTGKFTWGNKANHRWVMTTNFLF